MFTYRFWIIYPIYAILRVVLIKLIVFHFFFCFCEMLADPVCTIIFACENGTKLMKIIETKNFSFFLLYITGIRDVRYLTLGILLFEVQKRRSTFSDSVILQCHERFLIVNFQFNNSIIQRSYVHMTTPSIYAYYDSLVKRVCSFND